MGKVLLSAWKQDVLVLDKTFHVICLLCAVLSHPGAFVVFTLVLIHSSEQQDVLSIPQHVEKWTLCFLCCLETFCCSSLPNLSERVLQLDGSSLFLSDSVLHASVNG